MSDLHLTQHAIARMAQRGIQPSDIPFILAVGSEVPDGLMVLKSDVLAFEREVKSLLKRLHHLQGKRLVTDNGCIVTAYHPSKRKSRSLLRRQQEN